MSEPLPKEGAPSAVSKSRPEVGLNSVRHGESLAVSEQSSDMTTEALGVVIGNMSVVTLMRDWGDDDPEFTR